MNFGADACSAADFIFAMTRTRYNRRDVDPSTVARIRAEVTETLTEFETTGGVRIPGAVQLATASR